jgi:hypothetical protein
VKDKDINPISDMYSLLLATNSLLIEKGIIKKEELQLKRTKINNLINEYSLLITSEYDKEVEDKKIDRAIEVMKEFFTECKVEDMEEELIKKQFSEMRKGE